MRCSASSTAASPPPTTITGFCMKNEPSQEAQWEMPRPRNASSPGTPRVVKREPLATITVRAAWVPASDSTSSKSPSRRTAVTSFIATSRPAAVACSWSRGPRV